MSTADVPEPWASRMKELRLVDPRYKDDIPSMSALAEAADLHTSTVSNAIHGRRKVSPKVVMALVSVLGTDVQGWLGRRVELGPYQPPAESAMLTSRQRKALTEMIRSMVDDEARATTTSHDVVDPPAGEADRASVTEDPPAAAVVDDPLWTEYNATRKKSPAKGDE